MCWLIFLSETLLLLILLCWINFLQSLTNWLRVLRDTLLFLESINLFLRVLNLFSSIFSLILGNLESLLVGWWVINIKLRLQESGRSLFELNGLGSTNSSEEEHDSYAILHF